MALFDDLRSAWGARPPKNTPTYVAASRRTEFMTHWNGGPTGLTAASDHARCLAVVKADQNFHMDGRGWSDIGYNGLICPHARAIECRGIDFAGAHCTNHNTSAYGWQFAIGQGETVTPAMFDRMARALADCETRSGHSLRKLGHRDGFSTQCPGDQVEAWIKAGMTATSNQEDDMFTDADRALLERIALSDKAGQPGLPYLSRQVKSTAQLVSDLAANPDAFADKVVAKLGGSTDAAAVKQAVKEALREGVE